MASLTIDFFHDVVRCRCFDISPRMRDLPPHLMRDIGLDAWPDRPRLPAYSPW